VQIDEARRDNEIRRIENLRALRARGELTLLCNRGNAISIE
jgi:hypothetical protein